MSKRRYISGTGQANPYCVPFPNSIFDAWEGWPANDRVLDDHTLRNVADASRAMVWASAEASPTTSLAATSRR